ncbi:MAG TPA: acyl-CoA dehydrogenase family protein, partial [Acidimicrobiales bacterium]|nr:acyl-CoA dehydrogenase family protein [Acidimicrobiales bacterium]
GACKILAAEVLTDLSEKCLHLHGALGTSNLMELGTGYGMMMGIMDGPSEVHKVTIARQVLKDYEASPDMWPTEFVPRKLVNARRNFESNIDKMGLSIDAFTDVLQKSRGGDATINAMEAYLDATIGNL